MYYVSRDLPNLNLPNLYIISSLLSSFHFHMKSFNEERYLLQSWPTGGLLSPVRLCEQQQKQ